MTANLKWREDFGQRLKILMLKAKIKQKDFADLLRCSQAFVSAAISGRSVFTAEQFAMVFDILANGGIEDQELNELQRMFIEARANIGFEQMIISPQDIDPLKQLITEDLDALTQKQLKELYRVIERMKNANIDQMAANAGI